jgi:hypothetical protein
MSCSECGNEINKGICERCCEHCREVRSLEQGIIEETINTNINSAIEEIEKRETTKAIILLKNL